MSGYASCNGPCGQGDGDCPDPENCRQDDLDPARGVIVTVLLGIAAWALIVWGPWA